MNALSPGWMGEGEVERYSGQPRSYLREERCSVAMGHRKPQVNSRTGSEKRRQNGCLFSIDLVLKLIKLENLF